jgi:hypothetical protein
MNIDDVTSLAENPALSVKDRYTLRQFRKEAPIHSSSGPEADTEKFLRTIPLSGDVEEFLRDIGHKTLLSVGLPEIDRCEREKGTRRISQLHSAATAILWAEVGVRLALGETISVGGSPVDSDWLALIDIVPCSTETLVKAEAVYAKLAAEGRDADKKQS